MLLFGMETIAHYISYLKQSLVPFLPRRFVSWILTTNVPNHVLFNLKPFIIKKDINFFMDKPFFNNFHSSSNWVWFF